MFLRLPTWGHGHKVMTFAIGPRRGNKKSLLVLKETTWQSSRGNITWLSISMYGIFAGLWRERRLERENQEGVGALWRGNKKALYQGGEQHLCHASDQIQIPVCRFNESRYWALKLEHIFSHLCESRVAVWELEMFTKYDSFFLSTSFQSIVISTCFHVLS